MMYNRTATRGPSKNMGGYRGSTVTNLLNHLPWTSNLSEVSRKWYNHPSLLLSNATSLSNKMEEVTETVRTKGCDVMAITDWPLIVQYWKFCVFPPSQGKSLRWRGGFVLLGWPEPFTSLCWCTRGSIGPVGKAEPSSPPLPYCICHSVCGVPTPMCPQRPPPHQSHH